MTKNTGLHCLQSFLLTVGLVKIARIFHNNIDAHNACIFRAMIYLVDSVSITLDICSHYTVRYNVDEFPRCRTDGVSVIDRVIMYFAAM